MTQEEAHEATILITGFGQFLDIRTNPSYEISQLLPDTINGIHIIAHPSPLKAEYHSLLEITKLLEEHQPDVIIHMGLAADRDYFAIEKGADRDGYHQIPDEKRQAFTRAETKKVWGKSPERLNSTLDIEGVVDVWNANLKNGIGRSKGKQKGEEVDARASDDVGNYVCGFVYYASLEWFWRRGGPAGERKVLFFHVPRLEGKEEIEKGREVAVALIKAVIESCGL